MNNPVSSHYRHIRHFRSYERYGMNEMIVPTEAKIQSLNFLFHHYRYVLGR